MKTYRVPPGANDLDLASFLASHAGVGEGGFQGRIWLNKRELSRGENPALHAGDRVGVAEGAANEEPGRAPEVLFRCPHYLVISKPAGVLSDTGQAGEAGLAGLAPEGTASCANRLDLPVSGLMVLGLGKQGARFADGLFRGGLVRKVYVARTAEALPPRLLPGKIYTVRQKVKWNSLARRSTAGQAGRDAESLLLRLDDRHLLVRILSGRTHQIRVHLAWLGIHLQGDLLYSDPAAGPFWKRKRSRRIALHSLWLTLEEQDGPRTFFLPPGEDWLALFGPVPEGLEPEAERLGRADTQSAELLTF